MTVSKVQFKFTVSLPFKREKISGRYAIGLYIRIMKMASGGRNCKLPPEISRQHVFDWTFQMRSDGSYLIFESNTGSQYSAAAFVHHILKKWDSEDCVSFAWMGTFKKDLDAGQYSAGAFSITKDGIESTSLGGWLDKVYIERKKLEHKSK